MTAPDWTDRQKQPSPEYPWGVGSRVPASTDVSVRWFRNEATARAWMATVGDSWHPWLVRVVALDGGNGVTAKETP